MLVVSALVAVAAALGDNPSDYPSIYARAAELRKPAPIPHMHSLQDVQPEECQLPLMDVIILTGRTSTLHVGKHAPNQRLARF